MRIFLNYIEADTFPNTSPVGVSYSLAPLGDIATRRANFSTSFTLPLTDANRELIGIADTIQATNTVIYAPLVCTIEQAGARVIDNGKAIVENITAAGIELTAYSGLFGFFDGIKDINLQELDLTDLDHNWDLTDVSARVAPAALANGFTWAISDLGGNIGALVDIQYQRPTVTLYELTKRIIEAQGYTLAGDFWTSTPFDISAILLMESDKQRRRDFREARNFIYKRDENNLVSVSIFDNTGPQTWESQVLFSIAEDPGNVWNGNTFIENSGCTVDFKVEIDWADYSDNDPGSLYTLANYTTELILIAVGGGETVLASNVSAATFLHTASLSASSVIIAAGETVIVRVSIDVSQPSPPAGYNLAATFNLKNATIKTSKATGNFVLNSAINAGSMLPDMTQKSFLLMVAKMFGLILTVDEKAGTFTALKYNDILADRNSANDWSAKVIPVPGTIYQAKRSRSDEYGQRSILEYENDELSPDMDYGRSWLVANDTTLEREKVLASIPLAASANPDNVSIGVPLLEALLYEFDGVSIYNETEKDFIDRVTLLYEDYPGNLAITLQEGSGGATAVIASGDYLACVPVTDLSGAANYGLHFDRYLSRDGYSNLQTVLENYQEIDVWMMLDPVDITNLDLTKLIYLRQFAAYFYIEEIQNFTAFTPTKATLIKVS